jgi:hypothetical protein
MNITSATLQRFWAVVRQMAGFASIILGAIPETGLPNAVRIPLVAFGGIVTAIEHYVADPSTGTTPPPAPKS